MQPGESINPNDKSDVESEGSANPNHNAAPTRTQNDSNQVTNISNENLAGNSAQVEQASPWQYNQEGGTDSGQNLPVITDPVNWTASEFIDHEKKSSWYMGLAGLTVVVVALIYLITHDYVTSVVIVIAAILFGVTAKRRPRTLQYQIDDVGVIIDNKHFPYEVFKSFTVLAEGAFNSIQLMPLKRFMPPISLYFPPENESQIVATLGSYLPHEKRNHDAIETLMRKVRF